jgi:polyisoprenoid-binding protein YceI
MKKSLTAGALVALALSVIALQSSADTASTLADSKSGTYKVETGHTQVGFSLSHFGFTNYSGLFSGATGSLQVDPKHLEGTKLDVTIPVQSLLTTVPVLTEELKGDKWFDAAKYPAATFTSTKVVASAEGATITGNFTLRGVTKPVVLQAHFLRAGVNPIDKAYTIGFQATGTIKRTDYGISLYAPAVGDEVSLTIAAAFELQS